MLTEREVIDRIEVLEDGQLQIRRALVIERDGVEIARQFHRVVLEPGSAGTSLPARVRAVATAVWTPEVVEAYRQNKANRSKP